MKRKKIRAHLSDFLISPKHLARNLVLYGMMSPHDSRSFQTHIHTDEWKFIFKMFTILLVCTENKKRPSHIFYQVNTSFVNPGANALETNLTHSFFTKIAKLRARHRTLLCSTHLLNSCSMCLLCQISHLPLIRHGKYLEPLWV